MRTPALVFGCWCAVACSVFGAAEDERDEDAAVPVPPTEDAGADGDGDGDTNQSCAFFDGFERDDLEGGSSDWDAVKGQRATLDLADDVSASGARSLRAEASADVNERGRYLERSLERASCQVDTLAGGFKLRASSESHGIRLHEVEFVSPSRLFFKLESGGRLHLREQIFDGERFLTKTLETIQLTADTWHQIRFRFDLLASTFALSVDEAAESVHPLQYAHVTLARLLVGAPYRDATATGAIYLDDVFVD
jgi:hypothetical protein